MSYEVPIDKQISLQETVCKLVQAVTYPVAKLYNSNVVGTA